MLEDLLGQYQAKAKSVEHTAVVNLANKFSFLKPNGKEMKVKILLLAIVYLLLQSCELYV